MQTARARSVAVKPPPLPAEMLNRIVRLAKLDGLSVLVVAAAGALISVGLGNLGGFLTGLLIAAAGASERHGGSLLQKREERGLKWLVRSQLYLLCVILLYALTRLGSYDPEYVRSIITPEMQQAFQQAGLSVADILPLVRMAFYALYGGLAIATVLYQGGLALYYWRRAETVRTALGGSSAA